MPIYEYACDECRAIFEQARSIHDDSMPSCPDCQHTSVRRLISASSFRLKGAGWYVTDYARSGSTGEGATSG